MVEIKCMQCNETHKASHLDVFEDELGYGMKCWKTEGTFEISEEDYNKAVKNADENEMKLDELYALTQKQYEQEPPLTLEEEERYRQLVNDLQADSVPIEFPIEI